MDKRQPKQCPFLKQLCIEGRCELWNEVKLTRPGHILGTIQNIEAEGCVFNLLLLPMTLPPVVVPRRARPPEPPHN